MLRRVGWDARAAVAFTFMEKRANRKAPQNRAVRHLRLSVYKLARIISGFGFAVFEPTHVCTLGPSHGFGFSAVCCSWVRTCGVLLDGSADAASSRSSAFSLDGERPSTKPMVKSGSS